MPKYVLEEQIGFILRQVSQRHVTLFSKGIPDLPPMQFAVLAQLRDAGPLSQNELGRQTAMDAATIKGVVDRLDLRGLVQISANALDNRRVVIDLTEAGWAEAERLIPAAVEITAATLAPLTTAEAKRLLVLLRKLS